MARTGRPKAELVLSDVERETLVRWSRRRNTAQALAFRSRVVLACAEGSANKDVATALGTREQTVAKWRGRFVRGRLEGLSDEPRPGAPRTITDKQVEEVIVKTLEEKPAGGDTHWSTRGMASATGLSQTAISRIWRAFGLKPHLVDTYQQTHKDLEPAPAGISDDDQRHGGPRSVSQELEIAGSDVNTAPP